jgi:hypothetical protein
VVKAHSRTGGGCAGEASVPRGRRGHWRRLLVLDRGGEEWPRGTVEALRLRVSLDVGTSPLPAANLTCPLAPNFAFSGSRAGAVSPRVFDDLFGTQLAWHLLWPMDHKNLDFAIIFKSQVGKCYRKCITEVVSLALRRWWFFGGGNQRSTGASIDIEGW